MYCGGCLRPWFMARPSMATVVRTPAPLYTVYSPHISTAMFTVINQCCPNHCLATCLFTMVTQTQVIPLVQCTAVQFFFHTSGQHTAPVALHFAHVLCLSPICSVHSKRDNIFSFQSFSYTGFTSKPATKNLVGHRHGQGSAPFFVL
jgi:hypothetical protein